MVPTDGFTTADETHMTRAVTLAARAIYAADPNPRVGCVLVKNDRVIGEGWHRGTGGPHAEIEALRAADDDPVGATAYVTLEPCAHFGRTPPCADALVDARVARVVAAMEDPNPKVQGEGFSRLQRAGIEVKVGLMADESSALNPGFIQRMRIGRPYTRLKLAVSLDGRTALANGESAWITGPTARADVQHLRARSSVILTDAGTVRIDNPRLNVREEEIPAEHRTRHPEPAKQPARAIVSASGRLPKPFNMASAGGPILVFSPEPPAGCETVEHVPMSRTPLGVDLGCVLTELGRREYNEVHVECGPSLAGQLLEAGLIDEFVTYIAPCLLGSDARPLAHLGRLEKMTDRIALTMTDATMIGQDIRLTFRPAGDQKREHQSSGD